MEDADELADASESGDSPDRFISYARNGEDVVLWRALNGVAAGVFVDLDAAHPIEDSVTWAFYERGWSGVNLESSGTFADEYQQVRRRDTTITADVDADSQAAMASLNEALSGALSAGTDIHFLKIDAEHSALDALAEIDFEKWRPWVILVQTSRPDDAEVAGRPLDHLVASSRYVSVPFDGVSRFYVAEEQKGLIPLLSHPASARDEYQRASVDVLSRENALLRSQVGEATERQTEQWSIGVTEIFSALSDRDDALRMLGISRKRTARAEKRLRAIEGSGLGQMRRAQLLAVSKARRALKLAPLAGSTPVRVPARAIPEIMAGAPDEVLQARLSAVLSVLGQADGGLPIHKQLEALASEIETFPDPMNILWLCGIAFNSRYPTASQVESLHRTLTLHGSHALIGELLGLRASSRRNWAHSAPMEILAVPLVDVSHTAQYNSHTGVQRVVREAVPRWAAEQELALAVLDERANVWRPLKRTEEDRVLRWPVSLTQTQSEPPESWQSILVPWRTSFISPELVLEKRRCEYITALARYSGSEYCAIVYDLIPVTMPEVCSEGIRTAFSYQLSAINSSRRLSAISGSVALDVGSYSRSLVNQGVRQPEVRPHSLPVQPNPLSRAQAERYRAELFGIPDIPLVLSVSSIEPRKNQTAILLAAEQLWREGHQFQLLFIAGHGWLRDDFDEELKRARDAGRAVRVISRASENLLWAAYQLARFSVFVSLAEGYGLPAAESIGSGTPVVLTNYGSMAEIGENGGAEFVDPRSPTEVTDAMRLLLTDDEYLDSLREGTSGSSASSWDDYARTTWAWLAANE